MSPVRIWIDGWFASIVNIAYQAVGSFLDSFDLFHHGHANAARQASGLGDVLVAGVHSDEEIENHKGPPVLTLEERCQLVAACRWVDEIVPNAPYVTEVEFVRQYGIQYVIHGDDVTTDAEGYDTYRKVKAVGMYKECQRTLGVSTTDAIGRVLTGGSTEPAASTSFQYFRDLVVAFARDRHHPDQPFLTSVPSDHPSGSLSDLAYATLTSEDDCLFVIHRDALADTTSLVYIFGAFDGFLPEVVERFERTAQHGKKLVVGIADAEAIVKATDQSPIFGLRERALSVLQCKYVSGIVMPAPRSPAFAKLFAEHVEVPIEPSPLYGRIEAQRSALEARQARKLGKSVIESGLRPGNEASQRI